MKILHISDTHGFEYKSPISADLVIHSGDCSNYKDPYRNEHEVRTFIEWYSKIPIPKIYVAGNHDTSIEKGLIRKSDFTNADIIYLQDESITINNFKIYGTPWTKLFYDWAFMLSEDRLKDIWDMIPEDTDILISHGPPYGIRDSVYINKLQTEHCGSITLYDKIQSIKPKLVCFGHIHSSKYIENNGISIQDGVQYSNASCVTDRQFNRGLTSFGNLIIL